MDQTFEEIINAEKPVLIDFYADWCGPCQMLGPVLKELKDILGNRINIIKVNVDNNPEVSSHYRIKGVPTMMLFQESRLLWRQSGVISKAEIVDAIMQKCIWPELPGQEKI
ncbi:MAG TPA: thioredoxin [Flavobacterium sp.]|uniref:thioredoxin n=1 Tax=Flavobacterium sp. TaxID=239 RepID=UPI002C6E22AD|nr:thioredoxin [Flavobacterium sp.]HNP32927.1 thioredoxin [Flavobacterium sp.]